MINGRIPQNVIDEILNRADIAEIIGGYIPLKRAGRNFRALCPFHHEKTPSFMVSPERQIYHCFGCNKGGNAINFLMQYEHLEFPEAVEFLARKTGVVLPEIKEEDRRAANLILQLYKINELAASFYADILNSPAGTEALHYLKNRGLKPETIKTFRLGYAPAKWDALTNHLRAKGLNLSLLEKAGLIVSRQGSGGYRDLFHNRIIFPIFDVKSRTLGFGARMLPEKNNNGASPSPKYINSPETPVYIKRNNLYGLNFAKEAIKRLDFAVIVEGYLDFIIPYQEGVENIIASSGTAFTQEQARLIKRYTQNVAIVYDGDSAGEMAALRTLDIFIEEGINVKVAALPQGFDPDSFVRKYGIAVLEEKINQAENLLDYKLKILKNRYGDKGIEGKAMISAEMLATINRFKNAVVKSEYIKKLSQELAVSEDSLLQELKKIKPERPYPQADSSVIKRTPNVNPTEKLLIKLMLEETALINQIRNSLEPADFQDERASKIVSIMFNLIEQNKDAAPVNLLNYFKDDAIQQIICESTLSAEVPSQDKERIITDCIQRLKKERLKNRKHRLHEEIKTAQTMGDEQRLKTLMQEFDGLIKDN